MDTKRWLNQSQPQVLQFAVILLYATAVINVIRGNYGPGLLGLILLGGIVCDVVGGMFISSEKKWGFVVGLVGASLPIAFLALAVGHYHYHPQFNDYLNLMFEVALVALLVHPQSREYRKIWFR